MQRPAWVRALCELVHSARSLSGFFISTAASVSLHTSAYAQAPGDPAPPTVNNTDQAADDLQTQLDPGLEAILGKTIEELMGIPITSVAGVKQEWFTTPAAVHVITKEDARRSGHRTLAELMRLSPGMFVGQTNSRSWVVGARGFTGGLANKMLVLVDGRAIYDPLFAGTFWDVQDVVLEDIDRIEVIRGPGATLWGANAVNGVINVITQSARTTQGAYITGGGGNYEQGFAEARYGFQVSETSWMRVWGKYFNRDAMVDAAGDSTHDDWSMMRGGFRFDAENDENLNFTLQGRMYSSLTLGESVSVPIEGHLLFEDRITDGRVSGGHLLARLGKAERDGEGWTLQTYYDRTNRVQTAGFQVERDTADIDFRYFFNRERHDVIWGLNYRHTADRTQAGPNVAFDPRSRSLNTYSAFIQDTITLIPQRLFGMIGSKFEYNDFTEFEWQPGGRLWWTPDDKQTIWGAISRPVRIPSRTELDSILTLSIVDPGLAAGGAPTGTFTPLQVIGNPSLAAEKLMAYEAGYRRQLTEAVTLDIAGFYNEYDDLISVPPVLVGVWSNAGSGEAYGGEVAATWQAADNWRLRGAYAYVDVHDHGPVATLNEGSTPQHMAQFISYLDVTKNLEFNSALYYVDSRPATRTGKYLRLDLGLTWRPANTLELALWGLNLLDPSHPETSAREVERSVYLQGTLRF